jgi:pyruvate formate lyase activating enzyme
LTRPVASRTPLVVDIKRHSLDDGPGIRTAVFFKGCPLHCLFCHSPETQDPGPEIAFSPGRCIGCGACAEACPRQAIDFDLAGRIDRDRCDRCGMCADACPGGGLRLLGIHYDVESLASVLLRDLAFYTHSGGGVTLSGGECTLHAHYLEWLLRLLKAQSVHVVLETSGYFDYDAVAERILRYVDLVFFDIKFIDAGLHERYTGKTNGDILDNLRRIMKTGQPRVEVRVPLVPGVTATRTNLSAIVDFLWQIHVERVTLLPYNPMGFAMAESLGRQRPELPDCLMTPEEERSVRETLENLIVAKRA